MKRNITALLIAVLMCIGTSALAAEYDKDNNSVSADASAYQTVIITKDGDTTDDGIVYVNQADGSSFGSAANFLIKDDPDPGYYTMILGGAENSENAVTNFYIGSVKPDDIGDINTNYQYRFDDPAETEGYKNVAFTWDDVNGADAKSLIVEIGDKGLGWDLEVIADGSVMIGVQITDVPEDVTIDKAYISNKSIRELKGN